MMSRLWRPRTDRSLAVVTPVAGGAAALRLEEAGAPRPRLAGLAWAPRAQPDAAILDRLSRETGARQCRIAALLAPEHYQSLIVEVPPVPEEELPAAIRWHVRNLIGFHIDDAVLDYMLIPGGRTPAMYVVAAQSAAVRALANLYQEARLRLEVIDVRESAQNALAARLAPPEYAVAMLHLEGDVALLTFTYGHDLILSRRIEGRGAHGDFLLEKVAMEVQRSVDNFERQHAAFPLARVYLAPTTEADGLRTRLMEFLQVGVESVDLSSLFELDAAHELQSPGRQNQVFHLLGAALREAV